MTGDGAPHNVWHLRRRSNVERGRRTEPIMRFGLVAAGVPLTLFLEMRAAHAQSSRAVCASLQADALQRSDSILAIPRARWRPEPRDLQERSAIDMAHVVFRSGSTRPGGRTLGRFGSDARATSRSTGWCGRSSSASSRSRRRSQCLAVGWCSWRRCRCGFLGEPGSRPVLPAGPG